ncbi:MAG TPA: hypothetical protein VMU50_13610 [Polyangia bacterium]|nr:hypothetical protein [Polyangia bacterium]
MNEQETPASGTKRVIAGQRRVFYDGYWIKAYDAPADTLTAKKRLIEALTRRLFNHVEHGVNIPGTRLEEARRAFDSEENAQKKRVKAGMLAGALFNRAADVFTKAVELQALGVEIRSDNALIRQCGEHLKEALDLGKMVLHRSGEEGIDELWGEPFKAFAFPIEEFYCSRYIKIAQTMRDIDRITAELCAVFESVPLFAGIEPLLKELGEAAKVRCETLHTDAEIFDVWSSFVVASERLSVFRPTPPASSLPIGEATYVRDGLALLCRGRDLICDITRARVPMPKSAAEFIDRARCYRESCGAQPRGTAAGAVHADRKRSPPGAPSAQNLDR